MGEYRYSLLVYFGGLHMTIATKIIRKGNTGYKKVYFCKRILKKRNKRKNTKYNKHP